MRRATPAVILFICTAAAVLVSCVCARNGLPANSKGGEGIETMLDFYRTQSAWTDPGEHLSMYEGIPDGIGEVVEVVQNVLVHGGLLWLYELTPTEQQGGGMNIRKTAEMLERIAQLKSGSITIPRAADQRLVVNCRQFAVLTCSILRSKGVPARVRAGYALYTWRQGKYENHWICEYWHPAERRVGGRSGSTFTGAGRRTDRQADHSVCAPDYGPGVRFWPITPQDGRPFGCSCLLYTSPSPRDSSASRMPSSA